MMMSSKPILMTAIDLELNQPSDKIISIGAVQGNLFTGEVVKEAQWFVKIDEILCTDKKICDIPKLTGITDAILAEKGITLLEAYKELAAFHKSSTFLNPITWSGGGDTRAIREQLEAQGVKFSLGFGDHNSDSIKFCFGRRFFDAKQRFQEQCILEKLNTQSGLKKAINRCGLKFQGTAHEAVSDARNTFLIYHYLLFKHQLGTLKGSPLKLGVSDEKTDNQ